MSFTLPFGIEVDILATIAPLAPHRAALAAFLYLSTAVSLVGLLTRFLGMGSGVRSVLQSGTDPSETGNEG